MIHTSDYTNTFIEVSEDCKAEKSIEPPLKAEKKSIARMQYELLNSYPYEFTSDESQSPYQSSNKFELFLSCHKSKER